MAWRPRRPSSRIWWRVLVLILVGATVALTIEVAGLYAVTLTPFDTLAHAAAGTAFGGATALVGRRYTRYRTQHRVLSVLFVLQVALVWEALEVLLPGFAGVFALGWIVTAVDILATTAGAVLAMLVVPEGGYR